jgi:hypothetical protein
MTSQVHLLSEVAARIEWLDIACTRCDRRGRLSTARLVAEHGPTMPLPELRMILAGDCPRRNSGSVAERCDPYWPDLGRLFLVQR